MNKIFLVGRLTREPELRTTQSGISVAAMTVAVTRRRDEENRSDFINVIAWRGLADNCAKYLVKGQQVAVAGELRTRSYDAKDGSGKRYVTEVQAEDVEFLAKPKSSSPETARGIPDMDGTPIEDDNLPFRDEQAENFEQAGLLDNEGRPF